MQRPYFSKFNLKFLSNLRLNKYKNILTNFNFKLNYKKIPSFFSRSRNSKNRFFFTKYFYYLFATISTLIIFILIMGKLNSILATKQNKFEKILDNSEYLNIKNYLFSSMISPYSEYSYIIKNNDSVEKILRKYEVAEKDIKYVINEIKNKKLTNIYPGRKIFIITKRLKNYNELVSFSYPLSDTSSLEIFKNKNQFTVKKNITQLYKKEVAVKNIIKNNLYSSAVEVGVEPNIIVEFARIFGFEIDFQRDIRKNDTFEIYYEKYVDDNNKVRRTGKIIYASMFVNNKEISLYNFKYNNVSDFYDLNGKSIVRALMKTPINGARLSSSFGMRKHPILGFNKHHAGTDFAAPTNTPIMASGSGTVLMAQKNGGYGNYILIRHNSSYKTAYAHLNKFAKGIKKNARVAQGQIIGYVGSTGRSTGPHLHYEVLFNSKKINSQKLKLPSGKILDKEARKIFEIERIKIDVKLSELRSGK